MENQTTSTTTTAAAGTTTTTTVAETVSNTAATKTKPTMSSTSTTPRPPPLQTSTTTTTTTSTTTIKESVSKTLARLLAEPGNRSCADCRITLVDSSQVYASYTPVVMTDQDDDNNNNRNNNNTTTTWTGRRSIHYNNFVHNHSQLTPPGYKPSSERRHFASLSTTTRTTPITTNPFDDGEDGGGGGGYNDYNDDDFDDENKNNNHKNPTNGVHRDDHDKNNNKVSSTSFMTIPNKNPFEHDDDDEDDDDEDPYYSSSSSCYTDPAQLLQKYDMSHGVFVCAMCGAAHKLMGAEIALVHSVKDPFAWNINNVQQLARTGNAHSRRVLELCMPLEWKQRRSNNNNNNNNNNDNNKQQKKNIGDDIADRLTFVRAKYEALAFALPSIPIAATAAATAAFSSSSSSAAAALSTTTSSTITSSSSWVEMAWNNLLHRHHPEWKPFFKKSSISFTLDSNNNNNNNSTIITSSNNNNNNNSHGLKQQQHRSSKYYSFCDLRLCDLHRGQASSFGVGGSDHNNETISMRNSHHGTTSGDGYSAGGSGGATVLPNRLVDFFCVVTAGTELDTKFVKEQGHNICNLQSIQDFVLQPTVTDCYPKPTVHSDMVFPEHVGYFVYPEGCRPSADAVSPLFFTFVLTCSDGQRLYGGALKIHDKTMDLPTLKQLLEQSGYTGPTPSWFDQDHNTIDGGGSGGSTTTQHGKQQELVHSDLAYLPKTLVVMSHYPFFDLWRKFLLQIYRIALVEAPLPMERFIANFVSEVPLPPPGHMHVRFGFTAHEIWTIARPPDHELPLANYSFLPLFSCLSVPSLLVVLACLWQETRVVLCSKYYALLTPVAEALLGLCFPLHWVRNYTVHVARGIWFF